MTTAARVFVLAAAAGLALGDGSLLTSFAPLTAAAILAAIMSTVEFDARAALPVVPVAEAALAALVLGLSNSTATPLVVYLVVPPLVAGLRHGLVSVVNTTAAEAMAVLGILLGSHGWSQLTGYVQMSMPWMVVGLGVGLLAAWMRSSARALEAAQAPYISAHQLLTQLRRVSKQLPTGLDTGTIATFLVEELRVVLDARRTALLVGSPSESPVTLARAGHEFEEGIEDDPGVIESWGASVTRQWIVADGAGTETARIVLPARVADRTIGVVLVDVSSSLPRQRLEDAQTKLDEHSLRLDTALMFDEVRALATGEERTRLAREIHDGIAQEIASLGYLVDDLAASADSAQTRTAAIELREQLTRVVGELRLSIFDLRHGVNDDVGLNQALAEYTNEVASKSPNLQVHLDVADGPVRVRREVGTELLRIAQEAITNARKHAGSSNLWVSLAAQDDAISLSIADDGIGVVNARSGHFGLATMRERAKRIGAQLTIHTRPGGGTIVAAVLSSQSRSSKGIEHVDYRVAR